VELVESGKTDGPEAEEVVETSVEPLLDAGADTIVLGCTHYPFLADTIRLVASRLVPDREITIIDPAPAVAKHLLDVMTEEGISPADANGYALELIASGDSGTLTTIAGNI
jgi:glutamate racemase